MTVAIQLKDHSIVARWPNGCEGSRGIALDEKHGFLLAACDEGRLSVLDPNTGKILGQAFSGDGVDIIAYNSNLEHAYLPGEESATMAVIAISSAGAATVLRTVKTVKGAHCASEDDRNQVYICDPSNGRLLIFKDASGGASKSHFNNIIGECEHCGGQKPKDDLERYVCPCPEPQVRRFDSTHLRLPANVAACLAFTSNERWMAW